MELDYKKLGLKIGLEIHQQLNTHKLFCNCPSILRDDQPDMVIKRKMRAAAGETGKIDIAAKQEKEKDLIHNYRVYYDTTCLVELDEEPPHEMNKEALEITLQAAKMLNAKIVDQIEVMRKTIANGSVTSGFQRTGLVAVDGEMKFDFGKVGVPTILLEEDAAKEIESGIGFTTWSLDRLGIPLIELSTTPEIYTPEQAKQVAAYIGMILRSTGRVKHGIGTIRQDLNIDINGTERVEIKGAQDLRMIPKIVQYEVIRQKSLLDIREKVPKEIKVGELINVTGLFKNTEARVVKNALDNSGIVYAIKLKELHGLLGVEVQPGRRVGSELSDWAKAYSGVGGIFHSDELPKYGITEIDVGNLRNMLECSENDAFVIIADMEDKCLKALKAVVERVKLLSKGVIKQVRKVNADGTTSFLRLMPGAARMYPETDVQSVRPDISNLTLPELLSDKALRFKKKYQLVQDLAELVAKSDKAELFEQFCDKFNNVKPAYIAEIFMRAVKIVKHMFNVEISPCTEDFETLFNALNQGLIAKDAVLKILKENKPVKEIIGNYKLMSDDELEKEIKIIVDKNKGLGFNVLIGRIMGKLKGKADGKKAAEFLKKLLV